MRRVSVVGCSGSGKTTFAARLAATLGVPHVEMDALHWGPDWAEASADELVARVREATAGDTWVIDGNYQGKIGTLAWERADAVVWLDLPRWRVMWQVLSRTAARAATGRELWNGNRESWGGFALWRGEESVIWWAWTSHPDVRRRYEDAMRDPAYAHLAWHRLTSRAGADAFLVDIVTGRQHG
ncbi:MAG: AAA family ATPase [Nocardioides sp.]|uniref:AAA family ATPase n=1 Tax=Nocardioides sp. TaxID=35761 RepID=UPI0039E37ABA